MRNAQGMFELLRILQPIRVNSKKSIWEVGKTFIFIFFWWLLARGNFLIFFLSLKDAGSMHNVLEIWKIRCAI